MSKPFNLADAKAGHPVASSCGRKMEIFKYDYPISGSRPDPVIIGAVYKSDNNAFATYWNHQGGWVCGGPTGVGNLVMAPIGTIDGKPVYPGDMITWGGDTFPAPVEPPMPIDWESAKWPRDYPKTQMDDMVLTVEYNVAYLKKFCGADAIRAVANAAIRHGIDNGYLLDPTTAAKNIHNAVSTFASEVERRHAIVHIERERKMIRAGIEQGWREAYLTFSEPPPPHVERRVPSAMPRSDTDVDELIASVTAAKDAKEGAK